MAVAYDPLQTAVIIWVHLMHAIALTDQSTEGPAVGAWIGSKRQTPDTLDLPKLRIRQISTWLFAGQDQEAVQRILTVVQVVQQPLSRDTIHTAQRKSRVSQYIKHAQRGRSRYYA